MHLRENKIMVIILVQVRDDKSELLAVEVEMHRKILIQKIFRQGNIEGFSDLLDDRIKNKTEVCMTLSF